MHDERRLLKALARRDRGAWSTLYDSHVKDVFGFVYHLVGGNRPVAEDLNQEVWLAALEGVDRFDPTLGRFRDWLMGIARHRVARYLRIRSHDSLESSTVFNGLLAIGELPPADLLENSERAEITRAALLLLNHEYRDVLLKKYVDGSSVLEIASATGRSPKAVESLLSRARQRLRELLQPYFSHSSEGVRNEPNDIK